METSTFVSAAEVNTLVDEAVAELYDLLIAARGQEYYRRGARLFTVAGVFQYELPPDFYKLLAVSTASGRVAASIVPSNAPAGVFFSTTLVPYDDSRGVWCRREPFMMQEFSALMGAGEGSAQNAFYRLCGVFETNNNDTAAKIELRPTPSVEYTLDVQYVPVCNKDPPIADADITWDGIDGWEEHAVLAVAITLLGMEESSTAHLERDLGRVRARIDALADNRDEGRPERIQDVNGSLDELAGVPRRTSGQGWGY